jgi:alkylmercury lyase
VARMTTTNTINTTTEELAQRLLEWDGLGWVNENGSLMAAAIIELAGGEPVVPARVAERSGRPSAEVLEFLRSSPAEWDDRGRLVGFGLTLRPTRHRFTTGEHTLYTWCAPDALAFPVLIGAPAIVESTCFATGAPIRVEVEPDRVRAVEPPDAVVSIVPRAVGVDEFRERLCHEQHFFASGEAAAPWRQGREDVLVASVANAFEPLRRMMQRWAGQATEGT